MIILVSSNEIQQLWQRKGHWPCWTEAFVEDIQYTAQQANIQTVFLKVPHIVLTEHRKMAASIAKQFPNFVMGCKPVTNLNLI